MLALIRIIFTIIFIICLYIIGIIYCLYSPRNPKHVMIFGRIFGKLSKIFGIKIIKRISLKSKNFDKAIYISNHQNIFDMITISNAIQSNTVTVGKKSLLLIPFFGFLYWITGNILINRNNNLKAHNTIIQIVKQIKMKNISVWIFPEGTRSRGKGLLPFKSGAFYTAIKAKVPIIPICLSTIHNKIKLNRWNNGYVIIEILEPIDTSKYNSKNIRILSNYCYKIIKNKISKLDNEILKLNEKK
ncbi:1-acylglycerol-3-phosphate O-acyltransferase [Candidatus Providencia siddallii]|uniref:1-acyl-sn-glycerol-3-phosphate acyltransferase n=1 Tax=Candidatus Providencia siddallii TaxID=1715285 RepID=A0ABM9NNC7_9GAMM